MAGTRSRPPLSPTNTHISINSSPDTSSHVHKSSTRKLRAKSSSSKPKASLKSTSPAIDVPLDRLRGDIILGIAGLEIAKGTTYIWELRLQITRLGEEKTGLEEGLQAESFQLKKDVLDLQSSKAELEERVRDLEKERVELRGEFDENIKEREAELEELRVKTLGDEKILNNQDYKIKGMAEEAEDLKTKNTGLVGEVTSLKEHLNGVKRTWEDVKEGMVKVDEKLYGSTAGSKKPTIERI
ncbi:uncharacterized protein RCO7_06490 [Rhynchosporium graminicola]|uniref:Uncharacterized protein n=1 Tax=Rhynchosporium graminicola TaxID=2792576 RepID=A0A1E1KA93_9HELO|nr:uncharacterized protein RCO7_06490 [Rhynchosporium commune]